MASTKTIQGKRVCLITHEFPPDVGGVGQSAHRVATLLHEAGVDIEVLILKKHHEPLPLQECITTDEFHGLLVHRAKIWMPGWDSDPAKRKFLGSEAVTRFNREAFEVVRFIQSKRFFDLLHGFFLYPGGFLAVIIARIAGIKSVVSIRGNDVGRNAFDPLLRPFMATTLEQADYVTSVATSLLEFADKTISPIRDRSKVILNSFDPNRIVDGNRTKTQPISLRLQRPVVGTAGVFRYKKGLVYLFKALAELQRTQEFTLLLLGGFPWPQEENVHLHQLRQNGLVERTTITGMLDHSQFVKSLSLFDILVFPSMFSEGCPMTMLEAMSQGRVIVASRSGAIPEVIAHEQSGLLFEPGNWRQMQEQIARLLADANLRQLLSIGASKRSSSLSPTNELTSWLQVYTLVLNKRGSKLQ